MRTWFVNSATSPFALSETDVLAAPPTDGSLLYVPHGTDTTDTSEGQVSGGSFSE